MSESHPVLLYYHEIEAEHDVADGGVHELRVVPGSRYQPFLARMLPNMGPEWNVTQGVVNWANPDGHSENAIVELWPPRTKDADEVRLRVARMYQVGGWKYDRTERASARDAGARWFFVLELDSDESLTARVLRGTDIDGEPPLAAEHLRRLSNETPRDKPVRGAVDLLRQETA